MDCVSGCCRSLYGFFCIWAQYRFSRAAALRATDDTGGNRENLTGFVFRAGIGRGEAIDIETMMFLTWRAIENIQALTQISG